MVGLTIAISGFLGGCGPSRKPGEKPTFPVTGEVTYKGKPLAGASIFFMSHDEGTQQAFGTTDEQGRFQLTTYNQNDGAAEGSYNVVVKKFTSVGGGGSGGEEMDLEIGAKIQPKSLIPTRYNSADTTDLAATVKSGGDNNFKFELK